MSGKHVDVIGGLNVEKALISERALFLARTRSVPEPNTGCWMWLGAITNGGYAHATIRKKTWRIARALLGLPKNNRSLVARHRCDTPLCVNPDHIERGTESENHMDAVRRGRYWPNRTIKTHCKRGHELTGTNLRIDRKGRRVCKTCAVAATREWRKSQPYGFWRKESR